MSPVTVIFLDDDGLPLSLRPPARSLEGEGALAEPVRAEPETLAEQAATPDAGLGATAPQSAPARQSAARRKARTRPKRRQRARRRLS